MEYNIIVASDLEALATEVAIFLPKGWRLKGGILEHSEGFAQQLVRKPSDSLRMLKQQPVVRQTQRRTKWIE
ncbi:hypothetical protein [Pontibacter ruber]|uniref:DUF1737 domain-containing protein n=1 Tax=Pontibacter ruber TaxID=1343895 RepID=A0ABW5CST5_9BACT|nr:hypothetical protein [Pontibacter ruber]